MAVDGMDLSHCPKCGNIDDFLVIYILHDVIIGVGDVFKGFDSDYNYIVKPTSEGGLEKMPNSN